MTVSDTRALLLHLGGVLVRDCNLPYRAKENLFRKVDAELFFQSAFERSLPYLAFDGDQQLLLGLVRRMAQHEGYCPVCPPTILGYKEVVMVRKRKEGVMVDDLALLNKCDELWLLSDWNPSSVEAKEIAEGALIELLFAIRKGKAVFWLRPENVIEGTLQREAVVLTEEKFLSNLEVDQREDILKFLEEFASELPPVCYMITDPLDFKYCEWLRNGPYRRNRVPLIAPLAILMEDSYVGLEGICQLALSWLCLARIADSYVVVSPLHQYRSKSSWVDLSVLVVESLFGLKSKKDEFWIAYDIPKAGLGVRWPITRSEKRQLKLAWHPGIDIEGNMG